MLKRTRPALLMGIVTVLLVCSKLQAAQISVSWDGGGDASRWADANNWNPNIVPDNTPTETFAVTVDSGAGYVHIGLLRDFTIDQLDCYGSAVEIEKRTLHWSKFVPYWISLTLTGENGLTNYGNLELEALDGMKIIGNVRNTAGSELELWGRELDIYGNLYNDKNATIQASGDDISIEDGDFYNAGSIIVDPETEFSIDGTVTNSGQIQIHGGQFQVDGFTNNNHTGIIEGFGFIYADQLVENEGRICASGGSLAILAGGSVRNSGVLANMPVASLKIDPLEDVRNFGRIEVNAAGGIAFDCNLVNDPNGEIALLGGALSATTITQSADADFAGFGSITGDVFMDPNALIKLTGPTNIVGDVTIDTDATLEVSDGTTLVTGQTTCNGTIHMKGGRIIPQGGLSGNCEIKWEPGLYNNIADFNLDGNVNLADYAYFADTWLWEARL